MWMVRAGENAFLFNDFKTKKIVAIGWNGIGPNADFSFKDFAVWLKSARG